jgi:flavin-dependent dehydrogenase
MNGSSFDVAVIGGGPAGTSAAITAAHMGASVALFDASDFPRQKVCGEFVSAESLALLGDLLRQHPEADAHLQNAPVIARARIIAGEHVAETPVQPAALSIPRALLDFLLWEAAGQSGVSTCTKCEVLSVEGRGPFSLTTAHEQLTARSVILCAGRWSRFSDATLIPAGPKWIGVKAHYRECNPPQSTDLYFFAHGYCGVQPVGDCTVNVCAMVRSDVAATLGEVFDLAPQLARRAARWKPLTGPVTTAPLFYRMPQPVRDNILLAGDAAAFMDPFSGDGISLALRSGRAAAQCLDSFLAGHGSIEKAALNYQAGYQRDFAPLLAAAARVRSLPSLPEFAWPIAMQCLRIPGVLPYLVRKTRVI